MYCPFCEAQDTRVIDSRLVSDGKEVRRRRECVECGERFSTYEAAELVMPRVIKSNEKREGFMEEKLRAGLLRALEKRPVDSELVESAIAQIKQKMRATGERELLSSKIGEWVMDALKKIDHVAYVRFASVYRDFEDVHEFSEAVKKLQTEGKQ